MMSVMRTTRLLALLLAVLAFSAGVAGAATTSGVLTSSEYYQLSTAQSRTKALKFRSTTAKSLKATLWICEQVQESTPLLTEERASCVDEAQFGLAGLAIPPVAQACARIASLTARFNCLIPSYRRVYSAAEGQVRADTRVIQITTARRFSSSCARVLDSPPKQVAAERRVARDVKQIITALRTHDAAGLKEPAAHVIVDAAQESAAQITAPSSLALCLPGR